jgi:hypothetical protein
VSTLKRERGASVEEHEHRSEEEVTDEQEVEDLDVPEGQQEDVGGGYTIKQAWPKKYDGGGG